MFEFLKKEKLTEVACKNDELVSIADGQQIELNKISDEVFASEMMGPSIAFKYNNEKVAICAPCSGVLSLVYPTGHAFGITNKLGVEVLIHIGINSVNSKGDGFKVLVKQGDSIRAGEEVVIVDFKKLSKQYDMSTILIITNSNGYKPVFIKKVEVKRGDVICNLLEE